MNISRPQGLVEMIRRAATVRGRRQSGLFAIEGVRLVERALRAGVPLTAVLAADSLAAGADPRERALLFALSQMGCPVTFAPDPLLTELTEGRDLGLVIALVRLPSPVTLDALLPASGPVGEIRATGTIQPLFLAAVEIMDPGNVGALARTAHAARARALLVTGASDPFHPRATRISRGSIFKLPIVAYDSAVTLLADLRACGVTAVATAAGGGTSLPDIVWPSGPLAILMGNEAAGLPDEIATAVDLHVTIPMAAGVDSFSVNAAAAIVLYEAGRKRFHDL